MAHFRFHNDAAGSTLATTWVCEMPAAVVPYFGEAIVQARLKSVGLGLHPQSRSLVVHFPKEKQSSEVKSQIRTLLGKGGVAKDSVERVTPFDQFHAESWGLVAVNAPKIPEPAEFGDVVDEAENSEVSDLGYQSGVESDAEEAAEPAVQELGLLPDLFALAVQRPLAVQGPLAVPSFSRTLDMDTSEQAVLKKAFEEDKADPRLLEELFPHGMAHSKRVREEVALQLKASVDPRVIHWLGETPELLTIYHLPNRRRAGYIKWKSEMLGYDVSPATCMAIFLQVYGGGSSKQRLVAFQECLEKLTGSKWKDLEPDEQKLLRSMNAGNELYFCLSCNAVLDCKDKQFCSTHCASQWCDCGQRFATKRVQDIYRLELLQNRLGSYSKHLELAAKLQYKDDLDAFRDVHQFSEKFTELDARREERRCCAGHPIFVDAQCSQCSAESSRLTMLQGLFHQKRRGDFNWDICRRSQDVVQRIRDTPVPFMTVMFCEACKPARKKPRFL